MPHFLYLPTRPRPNARPLVAVHGISRNARAQAEAFAAFAERSGRMLVAPLFGQQRCRGYQRVESRHCDAGAALLATLADAAAVAGHDGQAAPRPVDLFGYSGGAQFAHRFALLYPRRVARLAIAAAGWYTFPSDARPFPYGLAPRPPRRDDTSAWRSAAPAARLAGFLEIPTLVMVGEDDRLRDRTLRTKDGVDAQQGRDRVERGKRWAAARRAAAAGLDVTSATEFRLLPRCGHAFDDCVRHGGLVGIVAAWFGAGETP